MATRVFIGFSEPLMVMWRTNVKCRYLLASVALASVTSAQVSVDWVATHDAPWGVHDEIQAVAVDATGRVAVAGNSAIHPPHVGSTGDYETCLYESDGTLAWSRSMDVDYYDFSSAVAFDGAGGLFVAGGANPSGLAFTSQRTLLHYDAVGNLLWSNSRVGTSTSSTSNYGSALALCPNGDVILAGIRSDDLSLERFDPAGNIVWSWNADGGRGGYDGLTAVAVGPGGDVWATGFVLTSAGRDIVVVRVSSAGVPVWIRTLNGAAHLSDTGRALVVDAAGYASVAGLIDAPDVGSSGGASAAIARWDPAGNLAWVRTYDGAPHLGAAARQIALDPFGRVVAGGSVLITPYDADFAVWCLDTAGSLLWHRTWSGPYSLPFSGDVFGGLVVDAMGAVWLCGASPQSATVYRNDLTVASWDSTGAFRWSWRYRGGSPGTNQILSVAAISGNSVILAGAVNGQGNGWDALILKLNRTAVEYCFGDGSSAPCPCANASAPEQHAGCANALGLGARLVDEGRSSLADDTLVLAGSQMPSGDAQYFQGTSSTSAGAGEPFGDGLSCVGGTLIRLGSSTNVAGASRFPDVGDPSVSVRGLVTTPGSRRTYQVWYRDASVFCTTANFNFSNGLLITWTL